MRFRFASLVTLVVSLTFEVAAQAPTSTTQPPLPPAAAAQATTVTHGFSYIVKTTNEMHDLLSKPEIQTVEFLALAKAMCGDLKTLLNDQKFIYELERLAKESQKTIRERKDMLSDLDMFTMQFMRIEEELLIKAGLSPSTVKHVLWSAGMLRSTAANHIDKEKVLQSVEWLTTNMCDMEKQLAEIVDKNKRNQIIFKYIRKGGGVVMIALDVGVWGGSIVLPFTTGVTTAIGSASVSIGIEMVRQ